jgi:hypothetical protein
MTAVKLLNLYLQNVRSRFLSQNLRLIGNSTLLAATFSEQRTAALLIDLASGVNGCPILAGMAGFFSDDPSLC